MTERQREIYHSENGDKWLLCQGSGSTPVYIQHCANLASGGQVTRIEIGTFLAPGRFAPEHQALYMLIESLIDD